MRRIYLTALPAALILCYLPQPLGAQTPAPAVASTPAAACPAAVLTFAQAGANVAGNAYAVAFQSFDSVPGRLSGTVTMFAGNDRYDVGFTNAIAVPALATEAVKAVPIVVRFPAGVKIDAAYLSEIYGGANPGPCGVGDVERRGPSLPRSKELLDLDHTIAGRSGSVPPIEAPKPVVDTPACEKPSTEASAPFSATPAYPTFAGQRGDAGIAYIDVALSAEGRLLAAWVWKTSGYPELDKSALAAAHQSTYDAGTFRCRPVFAIYRFYANFQHS